MKQMNRWFYGIIGTIVMLCAGCIYAWGVFVAVIGAEFVQWTKAQLSLTFTITMICFCLASILAGLFISKIPWKFIMITGGCFYLIGFTIVAHTHSLAMLYIGFGFFGGFGTGLIYNSNISTVTRWFTDKIGLISGIMLMGFGFGSFLIGKMFAGISVQAGGWRNAFQLFGIVMCIITIIGALLLQKPGENYMQPVVSKNLKRVPLNSLDISAKGMIKRPAFWCFYLWCILLSVAGLSMISQGSGICLQVNGQLSLGAVSTVIGLIAIMNGVGRVIFGRTYDLKGHRFTMRLVNTVALLSQGVLLVSMFTKSFPILIVAFVLVGLTYGGIPPLNSAVISEFYGRTHYAVNFPIIMSHLLFASIGGTLSGKLYDVTGDYITTVIMMLLFAAIAFVLTYRVKKP